jgi:hypothetical protein
MAAEGALSYTSHHVYGEVYKTADKTMKTLNVINIILIDFIHSIPLFLSSLDTNAVMTLEISKRGCHIQLLGTFFLVLEILCQTQCSSSS